MQLTKVFFKANKAMTGYSNRDLTKKCAEINQGDTLELLQCKIMTDEPTAFRYMEAVELYISAEDVKDVYFFEIKNEYNDKINNRISSTTYYHCLSKG